MGVLDNEQMERRLNELEELCSAYFTLIKTNSTNNNLMTQYTKINITVGRIAKLMSQDPILRSKSSLIYDLIKISMSECVDIFDLGMMQYFDFVCDNNRGLDYGNAKWSDYEFAQVGTQFGEYYIKKTGVLTCSICKI
jgi:hypothetical protein